MDVTTDWFWEGNVVERLAAFLKTEGWDVGRLADTRSKARGIDIEALRDGRMLLIEAKGYPSRTYRDPKRANEVKRTAPTIQAALWYSQALMKSIQMQNKHPSALVAMAFPMFPRYRALFEESKTALEKLGIMVFFVCEDGTVEIEGAAIL